MWLAFFLLFSAFAGGGAGQQPSGPNYALGRTAFVAIYGRLGTMHGYVKPWIANTYNQMLHITMWLLVPWVVALLLWAAVRRIYPTIEDPKS